MSAKGLLYILAFCMHAFHAYNSSTQFYSPTEEAKHYS